VKVTHGCDSMRWIPNEIYIAKIVPFSHKVHMLCPLFAKTKFES